MKITEISRTISGCDYSNISAKATLEDGEDFKKACFELDHRLKESLDTINRGYIESPETKDDMPF